MKKANQSTRLFPIFSNRTVTPLHKSLVFLFIGLVVFNLAFDFFYTYTYGGIDLRDKIVGARLLFTDLPNYYSWWTPEYPLTYLNPADDLNTKLSLYTGTPFQSFVFWPLAQFNYSFIRYFWFAAQYTFLISLGYLFYKVVKKDFIKGTLLLGVYSLFFLSTEQWHMHIERGQFYILFAFLHGLIYLIIKNKGKFKEIFSGFILGILILFKPTFAVFGAPFFFGKKIKMLSSTTLTMVFFGAVFAISGLFSKWSEYFTAMKEWQTANVHLSESKGDNAALVTQGIIPEIIEGNANLRKAGSFYSENSSIQKIVYTFTHTLISPTKLYGVATFLLSFILLTLFRKIPSYEVEEQMLLGFLMWVVAMTCMAAPRFSYQYIHWVVPISIIIINYEKYDRRILLLVLIGLVLGLGIRFFIISVPYVLFVGELIMLGAVYLHLLTGKKTKKNINVNPKEYFKFETVEP